MKNIFKNLNENTKTIKPTEEITRVNLCKVCDQAMIYWA